jgi:hypothetical protein
VNRIVEQKIVGKKDGVQVEGRRKRKDEELTQ